MESKTLPQEKSIMGSAGDFAEKLRNAAAKRKKNAALQRENQELKKLKTQLNEVRREINILHSQFNEAGEPECVAYYAYLLKANEAKYDYLLRMAREQEARTAGRSRA